MIYRVKRFTEIYKDHTGTKIDFSKLSANKQNGIIYYDISDHLPIFTIDPYDKHLLHIPNKEHTTRRKETKRNIESLKIDLSQKDWYDIYFERDLNSSYDKFINKLLFYYNKNVPLSRIKSNKKKNKRPWITQGILKSISTRIRLYKISLRSPTNENQYI